MNTKHIPEKCPLCEGVVDITVCEYGTERRCEVCGCEGYALIKAAQLKQQHDELLGVLIQYKKIAKKVETHDGLCMLSAIHDWNKLDRAIRKARTSPIRGDNVVSLQDRIDHPEKDETPPIMYLNQYKCICGYEWEDTNDCACDDRCPECNTSMTPYNSIDL